MHEHDFLWLDCERPDRLGIVELLVIGDLLRLSVHGGALVLECVVPVEEEEAGEDAVDLRAYWDAEGPFAFLSGFESEQLQAWCVEALEGVFRQLRAMEAAAQERAEPAPEPQPEPPARRVSWLTLKTQELGQRLQGLWHAIDGRRADPIGEPPES
jgi:hypothetical protein